MWICPKCGAEYVAKNMWHSCHRYTESQFLHGKPADSVAVYKYFLKEYRKIGPIKLHVLKSRIAFMVKVRFSGISVIAREYIKGAFWLKEKIQSDKFFRIEFIPKNNYIHHFRLYSKSDIDPEFRKYMRMSYRIGERKHINLKSNRRKK